MESDREKSAEIMAEIMSIIVLKNFSHQHKWMVSFLLAHNS